MSLSTDAPATPPVSEDRLIEEYVERLSRLSPNARLELAARLLQTLTLQTLKIIEPTSEEAVVTTLPSFVGAWADDPEADKMEAAIRNSRHFASKPALEGW